MKNALIVLWAVVIVLGIVTIVVVFYPSSSYVIVAQTTGPGTTSFSNIPTSTPTSSIPIGAAPTSTITPGIGTFASNYTLPYLVSWSESGGSFAVTGATWNGANLTLALSIQMGPTSGCIPVNLRLVADESGNLLAPSSPAGPNFIFPDTQSCNGSPGETYSQSVTFTVPASIQAPFLLTTGGTANTFFNVATSTTGGVDIALPSSNG